MKALAEERGKTGIESKETGLPSVKKKTKIVKKIVKKKVIKKVPKRVSVTPNLEKVSSPKPIDNAPMEIEKPNLVVENLREVDDREKFEVSDKEKGVCLIEKNDENEKNDLVSTSLLNDQNRYGKHDANDLVSTSLLGDHDQNQIEIHDREHDINININNMYVEEHESECSKLDVGVSEDTKVNESVIVKEQDGKIECNGVNIEGELSDDVKEEEVMKDDVGKLEDIVKEQDEKIECNGVNIEGELSNDVKEEEVVKDDVEKIEDIDLKPSDANEVLMNGETEGLRSEEDLSTRGVSGEETVASGWQMKQRTKIFIHGLDNDTKVEDIRKVFKDVGEVIEVKLITNLKTGKSRGFGFIRFASANLAKLALEKYHNVEICGRMCHTAAIEGVDTILLSNIDKKWNSEYVRSLLEKIGVTRIDEVSVVADPENPELNHGFAYLELETKRDAQLAYRKLQNKNVFGNNSKIKVSWAEPLADPLEEEMHNNIKSVYAEHIPSSWNENEVENHFKIYGEIESIALAKNLRTAKRNDFAFINYTTCEAALLCIEALTYKNSTNNNGSNPKGQLKVSLAKSIPKGKPVKTISEPPVTEVYKVNQKVNTQGRSFYKPHNPKIMKVSSNRRHEDSRKHQGSSSTTDELVKLLREQASWKQGGPSSNTGIHSGGKQSFTQLGSKLLSYHDPRAYHQTHLQAPIVSHPRPIMNSVAMSSFPHYDQQHARYASGSPNVVVADPRYLQTRDKATYPGSSSIYRQMR